MKLITSFFVAFIIYNNIVYTQENLIPNPDFEDIISSNAKNRSLLEWRYFYDDTIVHNKSPLTFYHNNNKIKGEKVKSYSGEHFIGVPLFSYYLQNNNNNGTPNLISVGCFFSIQLIDTLMVNSYYYLSFYVQASKKRITDLFNLNVGFSNQNISNIDELQLISDTYTTISKRSSFNQEKWTRIEFETIQLKESATYMYIWWDSKSKKSFKKNFNEIHEKIPKKNNEQFFKLGESRYFFDNFYLIERKSINK